MDPGRRVRIGFIGPPPGRTDGRKREEETLMVHFTCDLCGKDMTASSDPRYIVKIEVCPGFDLNEIREDDLDDDPMEAVSELLQRDESLSAEDLAAQSPKGFRFDLCPTCHVKFVKDPLGRETIRSFDFSQN
jgi:hypothetical protein